MTNRQKKVNMIIIGKSNEIGEPMNIGKSMWLLKKVKMIKQNDMSRQDVLPKEKLIQMQMRRGAQISCSIKNVEKLPKFMMNFKMEMKLGQLFNIFS